MNKKWNDISVGDMFSIGLALFKKTSNEHAVRISNKTHKEIPYSNTDFSDYINQNDLFKIKGN